MNNDLAQFSEEKLKEIEKFSSNQIRIQIFEIEALARIALAAKQGRPTFEDWLSSRTDTIEVDCGCVTTEAFYHWLKVAYEATPSHTEQDGWIKCSERMPQNNEQVLTWNGQYKATDLFLAGCFLCNKPKLITHWMPLPAAPKPESE